MRFLPLARLSPLALALAALALAPLAPAAAQEHQHDEGGSVRILADGPAYAGVLAGFTVLVLGDDDEPDFHQQNHIRVTQGGTVLFETTPDSGHDYDGVVRFAVAIPQPGPFRVEALDGEGAVAAHLDGEARPAPTQRADLEATREGFTLRYGVRVDGARVPARIQVEVLAGSVLRDPLLGTRLLARFDTVGIMHAFDLALAAEDLGARYRFLALPLDVPFLPVGFDVASNAGRIGGIPEPPSTVPATTPGNAVVRAGSGNATLLGTYDPWTVVGAETRARFAALGPAGPISARLLDAMGAAWFSTDDLAGPVAEFATTRMPGAYRTVFTAGDATVELPWTVLPPTDPTAVGPQSLDFAPPAATAGVPFDLLLQSRDLADRPFDHTEVDLEVAQDRIPVVQAKLHTHGDGDFPLRLTLPEGATAVTAHVYPLEARASTPRPALEAAFDVGPGAAPHQEDPPVRPAEPAPLGGPLAALALAAAAIGQRAVAGRKGF